LRSIAALGTTAIELRLEGHDAHRTPGTATSPRDGGVCVRLTRLLTEHKVFLACVAMTLFGLGKR
jgi:hypothetical protein